MPKMTQRSSGLAPEAQGAWLIPSCFQRVELWLGMSRPESQGQGHQQRPCGWHRCPSKPGRMSVESGKIALDSYYLRSLALLGFGFAWDPASVSSFWFSPSETGTSILCLSHHCTWEGANSLVSQDRGAWRATFQGVTKSLTWLNTASHACAHTHTRVRAHSS